MPRRRIIDQLRRQYPGKWRFEPPCYWHYEAGWYVQVHTCLDAHREGDAETYSKRYFRSDTGDEVFLDGTGAQVVLNGVSVVFRVGIDQPNMNNDLLLLGSLQGVKMLTDKPKVRHRDIKTPMKVQPDLKGTVHITGVTWYCPECHAELPGEHKSDCALIRKIMAGVRG
jgi:hypothetical protein